MNHRVAVWAKGNHVSHWIDNVIFTNRMQGLYVVHMNEPTTMFTIDLLKVKPTTFTCCAVMLYASMASFGITLVVA
jgi:hypothetical protein